MEVDIVIRNYPLLVGPYDPQQHCVINRNYLVDVLKWKTDILPNLHSNSFGTVIQLTYLEEDNVSVINFFTNIFCLSFIYGLPAFSCWI